MTRSERVSVDRVPPQNLEAEQSVLGSMLLDRDAIARVVELLRPADFYAEKHRIIYTAMVDLFERGEPVDLVTVTNLLSDLGKLEAIGGASYLAALPNTVPTAANADHYAGIVYEKAQLRALISAGTQAVELGYSAADPADQLIAQAEATIYAVGTGRTISRMRPFKEMVKDSLALIEQRYLSKGTVTGIPSGFTDLDRMLGGWQKGEVVLVAARPSVGKTTFVTDCVMYAALRAKIPVAVFSLEMSWAAIMDRVWAAYVPMPMQVLRTGFLSEAHWTGIAQASGPLSEAPISLNDSATISVLEMRAQARRLKADGACKLVVVDHLQMIRSRTRHENRTQEMSEVVRDLKSMAKELDVPVIVVSQLSRAAEMSTEKRPQLRHLRDSGELEQVADVVLFLYREEYHDPEAAQQHNTENLCEVIIAKHRNGPVGSVELFFDKEHARFTTLEQHRHEDGK